MIIRQATKEDYDDIWEIFHNVIQSGDTYVINPDTPKKDLQKHWFDNSMQTYVLEDNNEILGTYILKPNNIDLGAHIANCSYMVHPKAQGKGLGRILCEHSLETARNDGFQAMQFNMVVSTNIAAIKLWKKFGFIIIGTIPNGFNHKKLGYVDTHILYKEL